MPAENNQTAHDSQLLPRTRKAGWFWLVIALALPILPGVASAATKPAANHIALEAFSFHFKKSSERKGIHPAVGYEYSPQNAVGWQAGFFKDSFGSRSGYAGINYSLARFGGAHVKGRFILAANMVRKQFVKNGGTETHFVPMPILELSLAPAVAVNITGSPQLDYYNGKHTNGVVVFQIKIGLDQH